MYTSNLLSGLLSKREEYLCFYSFCPLDYRKAAHRLTAGGPRPGSSRKIILSPMIVFADCFRLNRSSAIERSPLTSLLNEGEDMKTRNTITKLITITMAVATLAAAGLLCGAGWLQPVEAQSGDGNVRFVSSYMYRHRPPTEASPQCGKHPNSPGSTVTWTYKVTNTGGVPFMNRKEYQCHGRIPR